MDPLVITVASTNVNWTKKDSPYIPETPEEIARDIVLAYREGATVAHIHARDETGKPTFDTRYFRKIVELVKKECDIIIQLSTGGHPAPIEKKLAPIRELRPEMASLNIRGNLEEIEYTAKVMKDLGVIPVVEAFNVGMIETANSLIKKGLINTPAHFELVFDLMGDSKKGLIDDYEELIRRVKMLPDGSIWSRNRGAQNQFALDVITIMLGGHIRIGLEDNLFLMNGKLAQGSIDFIKIIKLLSQTLGRKIANVEETKRVYKVYR